MGDSHPGRWMMTWFAALILMGSSTMVSCSGGSGEAGEEAAPTRLSIYTSCFPVDYLARRVAGEHADVTHILPVGEDPPEWTPSVEIVGQLQGADRILINGAGFESWVTTITLPDGLLVDTTAGVHGRLIHIEGDTHSHGKEGEHTHHGTDPHTWSDPTLAAAQATAIRDALAEADAAHAEAFTANLDELVADLNALDAEYKAASEGYTGELMATSHPAFNYVGKRYGWKLSNYGFEPDEAPDAEQLERLKAQVKDDGIQRMLWESMPADEQRAAFEATGVQIVFLDPLEQPPDGESYDYLAQARANIQTFQTLFPAAAVEVSPNP